MKKNRLCQQNIVIAPIPHAKTSLPKTADKTHRLVLCLADSLQALREPFASPSQAFAGPSRVFRRSFAAALPVFRQPRRFFARVYSENGRCGPFPVVVLKTRPSFGWVSSVGLAVNRTRSSSTAETLAETGSLTEVGIWAEGRIIDICRFQSRGAGLRRLFAFCSSGTVSKDVVRIGFVG